MTPAKRNCTIFIEQLKKAKPICKNCLINHSTVSKLNKSFYRGAQLKTYNKVAGKQHTGKCIRRFGGVYAYCRYFIDRKW